MSRYLRRGLNWYAGLWPKRLIKPPYKHVTQIGDPVLRKKCELVPTAAIRTNEIAKIIEQMKLVMRDYNLVGLSAPQIGIDKKIFIMEFTVNHLCQFREDEIKEREMFILPFMAFINPVMKINDQKKVSFIEGCASVRGYAAKVPRYKEVAISGYNENGEEVLTTFSGWSSRIVQHEMDHLEGRLYTDVMDKESFYCTLWREVNINGGKIRIPFTSE